MTSDLATLRATRDALLQEMEAAAIEAELRSLDLARRQALPEAWGDTINTREYLSDGLGLSNFGTSEGVDRQARPEDRRNGDNAPIWRTETEHLKILGACRMLAENSEVALGALENLTNYIIGDGLSYTFSAKVAGESGETRALASRAQAIADRWIEFNSWSGDLERETFRRSRRDGEVVLALFPGRVPELRVVDSPWLTEPDRPRRLEEYLGEPAPFDWKYGIATPHLNTAAARYYFVQWYGYDGDDAWDALPARRVVSITLNTDREVKRGLSDLYPVYRVLEKADRLLGNTLDGASNQAAISYIREHAPGVRNDQIEAFVSARTDVRQTETTPTGTRTRRGREIKPNTVVDLRNGAKYHAGPMGQPRGQAYLDVVQGALRLAGIRWQMAEYMISGDASNGNFASTLVAEAPFTKSSEAKQSFYCRRYADLIWAVVAMEHETGNFPYPVHVAKRYLDLSVSGPEVAVRNRLEDHQIRREEAEAGILSRETWSAEAGRDFEVEQSQGAAPAPGPAPGPAPVFESWRGYP